MSKGSKFNDNWNVGLTIALVLSVLSLWPGCVNYLKVGRLWFYFIMSEASSSGNEFAVPRTTRGLKKRRQESKWKRNLSKHRRAEGKNYISTRGTTVQELKFKPVEKCCYKRCYLNVGICTQNSCFKSFYKMGDKCSQDSYLGTLMTPVQPKERTTTPKIRDKIRTCNWTYEFKLHDFKIPVCKMFLVSLFQLGVKRFRTIQKKISSGHSPLLKDMRGRHNQRPTKISPQIWELVKEHWASIPHKQSHYSREKTTRLYFDDSSLNVTELFNLFKEFYYNRTNSTLSMKYHTYHRYFRENSDYSFRKPRSDTCDYCTKCDILLRENSHHPCKLEYESHKK